MEIELKKRYKYAGDIFEALIVKAGFPIEVATDLLNSIKDADVAPVVHGEWIDKGEFYPPCHDYKCSVCKKSERMAEHKQFLFCPNCGAKMDLKPQAE